MQLSGVLVAMARLNEYKLTDVKNQEKYVAISSKTFTPPSSNLNVKEFFQNIVIDNYNYVKNSFIEDAFKILSENQGIIKISLKAAASAPATKDCTSDLEYTSKFVRAVEGVTSDRLLDFFTTSLSRALAAKSATRPCTCFCLINSLIFYFYLSFRVV
jgi:hypothetical protein